LKLDFKILILKILHGHETGYHGYYKSKLLTIQTRDVSHCGLAIYIKKYLKAKEEL